MKKLFAMLIAPRDGRRSRSLRQRARRNRSPKQPKRPRPKPQKRPRRSHGSTRAAFDRDIVVVSREEGSGTRGAFFEAGRVEQKDADGNKVDYTTIDAEIVNTPPSSRRPSPVTTRPSATSPSAP